MRKVNSAVRPLGVSSASGASSGDVRLWLRSRAMRSVTWFSGCSARPFAVAQRWSRWHARPTWSWRLGVAGVRDAEQAEGGCRLDVNVPRVPQP